MAFTTFALLSLLLCGAQVCGETLSDECLRCILEKENGTVGKCMREPDGRLSCGPYRLTEDYWADCSFRGKNKDIGTDWQACAKELDCSETCVRNYVSLKEHGCTGGDRVPTCLDYARHHHGGHGGCSGGANADYVLRCCDGAGGC